MKYSTWSHDDDETALCAIQHYKEYFMHHGIHYGNPGILLENKEAVSWVEMILEDN